MDQNLIIHLLSPLSTTDFRVKSIHRLLINIKKYIYRLDGFLESERPRSFFLATKNEKRVRACAFRVCCGDKQLAVRAFECLCLNIHRG